MNIHIIGAGVIGLSTAYALAWEGHRVTVLEAHAGAAQGASFAPGGLISHLPPALWPAATRWRLGSRTAGFPSMPVPALNWPQRRWAGWRRQSHQAWLAATTAEPAAGDLPAQENDSHAGDEPPPTPAPAQARPPAAATPPSDDSAAPLDLFQRLAQQLRLNHEDASGHLLLARSPAEATRLKTLGEQLQSRPELGLHTTWLDADALRTQEPGLNRDAVVVGALRLDADRVANCRQMAMALRAEAENLGVVFRFNTPVTRLESRAGSTGWRLHLATGGAIETEHVVLCAGAAARELLRPLGLRLPLQTAHAYTLTAAIREPLNAPRHAAVTEAGSQISVTRQGQRVRVTGAYRLGAHPPQHDAAAVQALYQGLADAYPGAAVLSGSPQVWCASVLMTPDDTPVVGPAGGHAGLWLNVGHGFRGWAQSLASAQAVTQMMTATPR
ncbi:MAG: D-amino acid dehydrogenase 1 [Paracidovorax wautersii]|uniref:D-amino acid dehydrogenase 1 n=1 Tax=Paracidovorax wautersii TaxID=1177982 RepID=A0A7V8FSI8_9BURK|nr:MAG: D-amino acid dehydrogenase 1 [Paracidovorax wautersii]